VAQTDRKIYGYIRVSSGKQDVRNQRHEILEYARKHDLKIHEFVESVASTRKSSKQRRIDELLENLTSSGTLIVTELSRLGRSTSEVILLVNQLLTNNIRLVLIKQNLDLDKSNQNDITNKIMISQFSLFAELERDLISQRTKQALASKKADGIKLGKPVGTIQSSIYDKDRVKIEELLALGLSVRKIATYLGYPSHNGLNSFIKKHRLR